MLEPNQGPPLRAVSTYPADGAGFDCPISDLECGVPINTSFELRFDRYLLPSTAVRQSFTLYSGEESNVVPSGNRRPALTPRYDVIERIVTFELPTGVLLQPNTHYTAELIVPKEEIVEPEDEFGFRAFDGAPLDRNSIVRVSFLTSNQLEARDPEPAATCFDLVDPDRLPRPIFDTCGGSHCHDKDAPRMGLDLSSENGLNLTAIGRVAHQTETSPETGRELQNPVRFGVSMPRVDAGRPDNSYLMYKLLIAPENYGLEGDRERCRMTYRDPEACVPPSAAETERLRAWFLRGLPMPRTGEEGIPPRWLTPDELRGVASWIRAGAACP